MVLQKSILYIDLSTMKRPVILSQQLDEKKILKVEAGMEDKFD